MKQIEKSPEHALRRQISSFQYPGKKRITGKDTAMVFTLQRHATPFLEAKGKIRKSEQKFPGDVIQVSKDSSGRSIGKTFQLAGKKFAIVFE
jgi:hypothetical protein